MSWSHHEDESRMDWKHHNRWPYLIKSPAASDDCLDMIIPAPASPAPPFSPMPKADNYHYREIRPNMFNSSHKYIWHVRYVLTGPNVITIGIYLNEILIRLFDMRYPHRLWWQLIRTMDEPFHPLDSFYGFALFQFENLIRCNECNACRQLAQTDYSV